ncbi:MAG: PEP-CTERM sorting domain-containing protein [Phycisphaerales bacterium]
MKANVIFATVVAAGTALVANAAPQYNIVDLGVVGTDAFSQGMRISAGGVATGRSIAGSGSARAFTWTQGGGLVALPNLASRNYSVGNGVNDSGTVVGVGSTNLSGTSALPVMWKNGVASQLAMPASYTIGRANAVNNSDVAVGSVGSGTDQRAAVFSGGTSSVISTTTASGCYMTTAFGINDSGMVVGIGIDPNDASRNVGMVYNMAANTAFEVGGLPGKNGAICFDLSSSGYVCGTSMQGQGPGLPFIWSQAGGMQAVALPVGTSQASLRGVNAAGWAVGTASSAFAIPFLFDGSATYRLQDLLAPGSGWDLSTNTSSSAMGISDNGTIVGTGIINGQTHAYAMIQVPAPAGIAAFGFGAMFAVRRRRSN